MVCDSINGYCSRFKIYTGKTDELAREFGAMYDLVMRMLWGYFRQGYILYMDNYYSLPKLYVDLWASGVECPSA